MALALKTKTKTRLDTVDLESGDVVAIIDTTMELDEIAEYMDNSQLVLNSNNEIVLDIDQSALPDSIDQVLGSLHTESSKGHVASLLRCGMLTLADCDDLPPSAKKKQPKRPAKSKADVTTKPSAPATDTTEDDLDEDLDEDEPNSDSTVAVGREPSGGTVPTPPPAIAIDQSLVGIPQRIAEALVKSQLTTKAAIESYVASGKKLIDLDGIGPRTEMHLQNWLAGQPWPETK
jgi:hypothetical protein